MLEAFNLLKVKVGSEFVVEEATWKRLAKAVVPDISSSHLELLLRISDEGQKGHVGKEPSPLVALFPVLPKAMGNCGGGSVLERLWSMWEALGSSPSTA